MEYNFQEIEKKWQEYWLANNTYKTADDISNENYKKPKFYALDMFPYPSGAGLHVGHPLGYIVSDIFSRYKRHLGYNVLHPMGFDSFGLPAEQYAIQTGQHPAVTTKVNIEGGVDKQGNKIAGYKNQLKKLGLSYDWSREIRTSDPEYYKWTQWIFLELFEHYYDLGCEKATPISTLERLFSNEGNASVKAICSEDVDLFTSEEWNSFDEGKRSDVLLKYRLTYLAEAEVNWCADLGTVLANDEVVGGVSERGGYPVEKKKMKQWVMRISAYADRLLKGLSKVDWPEPVKEVQRNWIGKSKGASVFFNLEGSDKKIEVFTTRPDTIFGVSFMTLAPEHELVAEITTKEQMKKVANYVSAASKKSERDRMSDSKTVSGVFTGAYAIHPFTRKQIPIWISDYVLASYGTGAVMAVPSGDERDYAFAKKFNLPIENIFDKDISESAFVEKTGFILKNSDFLNGLACVEATDLIIKKLSEFSFGLGKINYRLRDAVFSRQRYWGEPVPIFFKKGRPIPFPRESLPATLPEVEKFLPTETGEPPLGRAEKWAWDEGKKEIVDVKLIDNQSVHPIELNTMPGWAGSSWYFNRYMDPKNGDKFASDERLNYWKQVDLYFGGSEHATGHLLYSRFWQMFLFDIGLVPVEEYASKMINQGMIQGESAFVFRIKGENRFVSHGLKDEYDTDAIHVDVSFVNEKDNSLDIEKFKKWRKEYENAQFIEEKDQKVYVSREIEKMSKSKFNVVNPDNICNDYGADTLRLYEMFLGPIEQAKPWNTQGLSGVHSFLKKFWRLSLSVAQNKEAVKPTKEELKVLHATIKKVTADIEGFSMNTVVSQFMIAVNELSKLKTNSLDVLKPLTVLLSPFAPHISEEIWSVFGEKESITHQKWPKFDEKHLKEDNKEYPVSFNGKVRFKAVFSLELPKEEIEKIILEDERTKKQLQEKTPKKVIVVPGKIINIVI